MSDQPNFNIDPPDRYASLRRTIWLTLLVAIVGCGTASYYFRYTLSPEELSFRLKQAFPRASFATWENAPKMTLYSLQSTCCEMRVSPKSKPGEFHGYPILGKVSLDERERYHVRALIRKAMMPRRIGRMFCFEPHHGLRAVSEDKTIDLVICFHCTSIVTYADGQEGNAPIGRAPEKYFNQLLENAGVPFDPQYKR